VVRALLATWQELRTAWKGPPGRVFVAEQEVLGRIYRESCIHGPTLDCDVLWASTYPRSFVLQLQGRLACARAALALRLIELGGGKPPAALAEAVPLVLGSVPVDPWDGNPVRFLSTDEGWQVYVVGANGRDDGGRTGGNLDDRGLRFHRPPPK
jgi:hypothetical protein